MSPLIFDIKRTSTTDGPGIRTVIFLKGCNLKCFWCHNPEGKKAGKQLAFFEDKCISCGVCKKVCHSQDNCVACGNCAEYCPVQARKMFGKEYTKEELLQIIVADKDYYFATGGGVTFSGGECMLYPEFLEDIARECSEMGISVAVDTAGAVPYASFEKVLPYVDTFLYDIKSIDCNLHKRGTGLENGLILDNLEHLRKTGKQIIIRIPEIPEFNQGNEVEKIKAYCEERNLPYEVLTYHEMGESKEKALSCVTN